MIKAIFWDNDGVLVDTERLYFLATQRLLATVGVTLTKEQYIEFFLVQGKGAWHLAAQQGIPASAIEQLRHERRSDRIVNRGMDRDICRLNVLGLCRRDGSLLRRLLRIHRPQL